MPWQQHVVDVALELDPRTGLPVYREVGMTVPRQQGKTLLILALMVHRALGLGPPHGLRQNIIYTAQTGAAARKKFEDDHLPILDASKLRGRYRTRRQNGAEAVLWNNRSKIALAATTDDAAHGETLDLGVVDEAFAHADDMLEQAFKPAMMTRSNAQMWWLSTAGTAKSLYLLDKVKVGRELVQAGTTAGVAFFEWSADPDADPADPQTWRSCMPALCPDPAPCRCDLRGEWRHTVTEETVAADRLTMKVPEFRRGYLNIADVETDDGWAVVPQAEWEKAHDPQSTCEDPVCFAIATDKTRRWATIAIGARREDGLRHIEIIDRRLSVAWVPTRIQELVERWRNCGVVLVQTGPAGALIADLEARDIEIQKMSVQDYAKACGQLHVGLTGIPAEGEPDPRIVRYRSCTPEHATALNLAMKKAAKRVTGDVWTFDRHDDVDTSPLEAITCALWGFTSFGQNAPQPPVAGPSAAVTGSKDFYRPSQRLKL